nr:Serine/threonine-protein kinase HipA [Streptococcus thermophilus]
MSDVKDLQALRHVRHADVYKAGVLAGELARRDDGSVAFTYTDGYAGPDVAFTLPRTESGFVAAAGAVPPFFAGLLPEGRRLTILQKAIKTSLDDELSLLLAIGNDLPGDVQVVSRETAPSVAPPLLRGNLEELDFRAAMTEVDGQGIAGVQEKASASMLNMPINLPEASAILKIAPHEYPYLVENEYMHLTAAKGLSLPVAEASIIEDSHGVSGLLVRRFDRDAGRGRIAMEDAAQILGITPAQKYNVSSEDAVLALAPRTRQPRVTTRALYLQWVFAWLTGNGDMHAKNLSLLQSEDGSWGLSPIYDIPCTALYRDFTLALSVSGRTKKLRARHWDEFADSIGLPLKAAHSANQIALKAAAEIDLSALPLTGSPLNGALRELETRRVELV